jgi:UDP-GlcNAc:undecaprenyl-phosphate GlcNAc-1-phosphate transferase
LEFYLSYGLTLVAGFLLALVFTPLSRALAISAGFLDYPKQDRAHRNPTPFLGGLAVALSAGLAFVILAGRIPLLEELWSHGLVPRASVPLLLFLGSGALVLGLLDDRFGVSPRTKLVWQTAIALVLMWATVPSGLGPQLLLWPIGLLWVVGLMNAFNLLDNLDGILGGIGAVLGVFLGALALMAGRPDLGALALAGAGASLGFLCFNFPPATIFLGDAGAFFIGFLLAGAGWSLGGVELTAFSPIAAAVTLVLSYPIFDVCFVIVTRRLDQRPVHVGGVDHTTHRFHLVFRGRRGLIPVYTLNILSGIAGLVAFHVPAPVAWSLVAVWAGVYASIGVMLARVPVRSRRVLNRFSQRPLKPVAAAVRREVA